MFAYKEFHFHDDYAVVVTVDIEDCPKATIPLAELFDFTTSTIVEDYLEVLHGYVRQQLERTTWLDERSRSRLLNARFATYKLGDTGALVSMRKPALQRMIAQTLREGYNGNKHRYWCTNLCCLHAP